MAKRKRKTEDAQDKRIEELKRRVDEVTGGQMTMSDPVDCSADTAEAFWKNVLEYEEAPWTTNFQQLEDAGVSLPPPESLNDEELKVKLWEVIQKLALLRVFIETTNHLSDRELYTYLWTDSLREETMAIVMDESSACTIQLLSGGSAEDNYLYLKYYADKAWRKHWHKDFPEDPIPPHEDPPYDRDRLLPKAHYGLPGGQEPN